MRTTTYFAVSHHLIWVSRCIDEHDTWSLAGLLGGAGSCAGLPTGCPSLLALADVLGRLEPPATTLPSPLPTCALEQRRKTCIYVCMIQQNK